MIVATLYRTLLASVSSRARVTGFLFMGVIGLIIAAVISGASGVVPLSQAAGMVDRFGLILLIPISALVFGSAALGDPIEDGTYVYLWLRPGGRWRLTVAAYLATITMVVPLTVVPTVAAGMAIEPTTDVLLGAGAAGLVAALAYSALFVLLGQFTQRSLVWGGAYLLIFEQFIARGGRGLGSMSIHVHSVSVFESIIDRTITLAYFEGVTSFIVATLLGAGALGLSVWRQGTMEVA